MERAQVGLTSAKLTRGLTDARLREPKPSERAYKVGDGGNSLYVVVSPTGSRSFKYGYQLSGRRETLTIGFHEPRARLAQEFHLATHQESFDRIDEPEGREIGGLYCELRSRSAFVNGAEALPAGEIHGFAATPKVG